MSVITACVTCKDLEEANKIAQHLLKKRLVACVNIIDPVHSHYLWPPKKGRIEEAQEAVLLCHTLESKYKDIEKEVLKIHSYTNPALYAIPVSHVSKKYHDWIVGELR
ncbi:MAG: CutA1 divalent ion tolerance protein [Candidatus Gottesmanbacteria bacterium GW2011_GWA1_47_8]|uniref:CutA1 divalent ion tolerance protein n=1 Tax=Candidatus Gottesmanbacteria bacterium GW2011_GWA1_47_8 TaxID=1618438 RepID=A0A0G1WFV5_9BACT|nr:MAG: CutA1 divalent ion tolerance protein [Candidatus Gottesmanbacteria bacterium GW2011_GWA1_47_8]